MRPSVKLCDAQVPGPAFQIVMIQIPDLAEQISDVAQLKLRVTFFRPIKLRQNQIFRRCYEEVDIADRHPPFSPEFLDAVRIVLADNEINLENRFQVNDAEHPALLN